MKQLLTHKLLVKQLNCICLTINSTVMKNKTITKFLALINGAFLLGSFSVVAQDIGTGPGWGNIIITKDIVIDEDFTGYEFLYSKDNTNSGNSKDVFDEATFEWIWGHRNEVDVKPFINFTGNATFTFDTCAFAPEWTTAWGYRDMLDPAIGVDNTTEGVSPGFVEVSRIGYGDLFEGFFMIDLTELPYVEAIQYSHSSCGGYRRGFSLLFSLDGGEVWDTLRYQPGDAWDQSYTKDPADFPGDPYIMNKTSNSYNCTPSAHGMLWEDEIKASNVMLKFVPANSQALRIHDLKIYGGDAPVGVHDIVRSTLKVTSLNNQIKVSERASVKVLSCTGTVVKSATVDNIMPLDDISAGIYIVKAKTGAKTTTIKIVKK